MNSIRLRITTPLISAREMMSPALKAKLASLEGVPAGADATATPFRARVVSSMAGPAPKSTVATPAAELCATLSVIDPTLFALLKPQYTLVSRGQNLDGYSVLCMCSCAELNTQPAACMAARVANALASVFVPHVAG